MLILTLRREELVGVRELPIWKRKRSAVGDRLAWFWFDGMEVGMMVNLHMYMKGTCYRDRAVCFVEQSRACSHS